MNGRLLRVPESVLSPNGSLDGPLKSLLVGVDQKWQAARLKGAVEALRTRGGVAGLAPKSILSAEFA